MFRLSFFIVIYAFLGVSEGISVLSLSEYDVIHVVNYHNTCSREDAERWENVFVNCFMNRKYKSSRDLFNIVARLLDHSKRCIKFATLECRPNYDGFLNIMGRVIDLIKEFSFMHVKRLMDAGIISYAGRDKIKDFNCVENSLTKDTYATCFSSVISASELLGKNETYDLIYQKEVETAILCTNTAKRQCSNSVKVDLNKVVRYILGVKQPEKEEIGNDRTVFEQKGTVGPSKPSEFSEFEKDGIDYNSKVHKFLDSASQPVSTEFLATESEKHESNMESKDSLEFRDFRKKSEEGEILSTLKSLQSTEPSIFSKQTTMSNMEKSEKANIEIDPKTSEDSEHSESTIILEHSQTSKFPKSVESFKLSTFQNTRKDDTILQITETNQSLKFTEFPNLKDLSNFTDFGNLKAFTAVESGKDLKIDDLEWNGNFTAPTELPKQLKGFSRSSIHFNAEEKGDDFHFTKSVDTLIDHVVADHEAETMTEEVTLYFEEEFTASTSKLELNEQPKSFEATKSMKAVDNPIDTKSSNPFMSAGHPKITMTENLLETTELLKTTTTERSTTIKFSKLPKPIAHSRTTTSMEDNFTQKTEVEFMTETTDFEEESAESTETTTDFEEEFIASRRISKLNEHPIEATKSTEFVDNPTDTKSRKSPISTGHSKITTTENPLETTELPKTTTTERSTTTKFSKLPKSIAHSRTSASTEDNFHNNFTQETETEFMTETTDFEEKASESTETATDFEKVFTTFTIISKLKGHSKSIEATKPPRAVDNPVDTTTTKPPISTERPKITTTENSMKSTDLPKTTTTKRFTTTNSSKLVKTTPHSTAATTRKLPRPTQRRTNSAVTQLQKSTARSRATTSTKSPKPTHHTTTSSSTKPPRITDRQRTTTTRRPRTSSGAVRSRSRDDDTPRPTEAPKPWYDFIVRPFVSLWRTVKSWFGW